MSERTEKEYQKIANKLMSEFSDFIQHCAEKYGVGHGMFIISLEKDNADAMIGSVFGNTATYNKHIEERMLEVAKQTIEGSSIAAKERNAKKERVAKKIADKVTEIAEQIVEIEDKKEKIWELANQFEIVKDGEINKEKLTKVVENNGGTKEEADDFANILKEMIEEYKED